jgi:hypothetical protein
MMPTVVFDRLWVVACHAPEGERFAILPTGVGADAGMPLGTLLLEADIRAKLTQAGLTEADVEARIDWARNWAATVTRHT